MEGIVEEDPVLIGLSLFPTWVFVVACFRNGVYYVWYSSHCMTTTTTWGIKRRKEMAGWARKFTATHIHSLGAFYQSV